MLIPPRNPAPRRWPWLLLLPVLVLLAAWQSGLEIDATNASMKAPGSAEAEQTRRLSAAFGGDHVVALSFSTRSHAAVAARELDGLEAMVQRLAASPDVRAASAPAQPEPDLAVVTLDLDPTAEAAATLQLARSLCPPTLRMVAAGLPLAERAIAAGIATDRATLVPLIVGVLLLLCLAIYRNFGHAIAALLPALLTILLVGSLQRLLDQRLDPVNVLLEPVLLTVGVATAAHYLASFRSWRALGHAPGPAVLRTRAAMLWPCTLATATTMLGFSSLALHPIPAVAEFGWTAALGTAGVHAFTLVLLPAWLAAFPGRAALLATPRAQAMRCYVAWLQRHRAVLVLALVLVIGLAGSAWATLRVDNDPLAVLPADAPFRRDFDEFASRLGGAETFALLVDADSPALAVDRLAPFVAALAERAPAAGLAGPPRLARDGTVMVPLRLAPSGSARRSELFDEAVDRARQLDLDGIHLAGLPVQIARDSERLVHGQLLGLGVTAIGLLLGLWIGLRSLRLALLGMVPNVLPCAMLYGALAYLGQPLTVANAMIGSVMLGLIVDNTIHLLHRFRHGRGTQGTRLAAALRTVLRPMVVASAVLTAGFAVGLTGSMVSTHEFAGLAAVTIVLALFADGVVLPVLLLTRPARRAIA